MVITSHTSGSDPGKLLAPSLPGEDLMGTGRSTAGIASGKQQILQTGATALG
jgi:hypothetical protein